MEMRSKLYGGKVTRFRITFQASNRGRTIKCVIPKGTWTMEVEPGRKYLVLPWRGIGVAASAWLRQQGIYLAGDEVV